MNSKLLGQVNLVLLGLDYINDQGFITLTTGILMDDPIKTAASSAMANGGVAAFVKSAAIELPRGIRINHVSPTMLKRAQDKYGGLFKVIIQQQTRELVLHIAKVYLVIRPVKHIRYIKNSK